MAGRHAKEQAGTRLVGPVATAAVVLALLVSGAFGAMKLTEERTAGDLTSRIETPQSTAPAATDTPATSSPAPATPSATPTPTPRATSTPQRASRGSDRQPATKKASPTPTRTRTKTTQSSSAVVSSGSCGASFYDEGQMTANGEVFDPEALTAAHKTLAFDTRVRVTNPDTGKSVTVRINDRGPFVSGRCLDLSRAAFRAIADLNLGEIDVRYDVLAN